MEDKELFTYEDSFHTEKSIEISKDDFKFVQQDSSIHDLKFDTKPTTFFKDAMRRFAKNKSSVAASFILGILILLTIILPVAITHDITQVHNSEVKLPSKLFNAGTGWWDGTVSFKEFVYDPVNEVPTGYTDKKDAVTVTKKYEGTIDTVNPNAVGGKINFWSKAGDSAYLESLPYFYKLNEANYEISFEVSEHSSDFFGFSPYVVSLEYFDTDNKSLVLQPKSTDKGVKTYSINEAASNAGISLDILSDARLRFTLEPTADNQGILLENIKFTKKNLSGAVVEDALLAELDILDANKFLLNPYWTNGNGEMNLVGATVYYCDFYYDPYVVAYGDEIRDVGKTEIEDYIEKGYMRYDFTVGISSFEILDDRCPVREVKEQKTEGTTIYVTSVVSKYRALGYTSAPRFLFGTDDNGKDLLKLTFNGLRTSLLLGICTFIICFSFGLVWGSISGYFGGAVDILMERFCDILGGIPFMVMITLIILNFGSSFWTFAMGLCLTGWMGTAARTRTQFYRFKGREYILASRTLGSSDMRLIFKHILPNAMGTIITSAVLMIPSVIFSEASVAYLGIGLAEMDSLGVILSDNQKFIETNPTLIVFPSVIMALIMISFNLFGNGLRDAFNPSLKGAE